MNNLFNTGDKNPTLLFDDVGLLQPANNHAKFYQYYWAKIYSLATNMFVWEHKTNPLFPTYVIEQIFNNNGNCAFGELKTRPTKTKESISLGYVFTPFVTSNGHYDYFGRPTKVRFSPFMSTNGTTTWQSFTVANSISTFEDDDNSNYAVLGLNTHLGEGLEWLPIICAKLAILETAKIDNINLLKQPLTIVADEFADFSADTMLEEFSSPVRVMKVFAGAGQELLESLKVHSTGAENYIDTYQKQIEIELKEAYERLGISTNVVDKKERVLQNEQLTQNMVSNLVYSEKYQQRLKFIEDIKRVFPNTDITCKPILTLPDSENNDIIEDVEKEGQE